MRPGEGGELLTKIAADESVVSVRLRLPRDAQLGAVAGDRCQPERGEQPVEFGKRAPADERGGAVGLAADGPERLSQSRRDFYIGGRFGDVKERSVDIEQHRARSKIDRVNEHRAGPPLSWIGINAKSRNSFPPGSRGPAPRPRHRRR